MLLQFIDQQPFATGAALYDYRPVSDHEDAPRIILNVFIGNIEALAFVDTGGVNFICAPNIASALGLSPEDRIGSQRLLFRGMTIFGHLHRIPLTILPQRGAPITVDVTAFVPEMLPGQEWQDEFPCILGMSGCLERLRFAVDPTTDTFYFGELTPDS